MDEKLQVIAQAMSLLEGYRLFYEEFGDEDDFPLSMKYNHDSRAIKYNAFSKILSTEKAKYFLNVVFGDLMVTYWIPNQPVGEDWVEISEKVYEQCGGK